VPSAENRRKQHDGIGWHAPQLIGELGKRKAGQEACLVARRERCQLLPGHLFQSPVERRGTGNDDEMAGVRLQPGGQCQCFGKVNFNEDAADLVGNHALLKRKTRNSAIGDDRIRGDLGSMRQDESQGSWADRYDDINPGSGVLVRQITCGTALLLFPGKRVWSRNSAYTSTLCDDFSNKRFLAASPTIVVDGKVLVSGRARECDARVLAREQNQQSTLQSHKPTGCSARTTSILHNEDEDDDGNYSDSARLRTKWYGASAAEP
jgi:hypothetical protein